MTDSQPLVVHYRDPLYCSGIINTVSIQQIHFFHFKKQPSFHLEKLHSFHLEKLHSFHLEKLHSFHLEGDIFEIALSYFLLEFRVH